MSYWRFPTSIFQKYTIEAVIRTGGKSRIYKAHTHDGGRPVVIKVLRLSPVTPAKKVEKTIARFYREATLCALAEHENVVELIEYVHEPEYTPYAVFEFVPGLTLKELIYRNGGLSATVTAGIMTKLLETLQASHDRGIVHRDLKPENIMVVKEGGAIQIKLLDFGIGTWLNPNEVPAYVPITLPNEFLGTPAYSAPEQLIGLPATVNFDLYSWGLIFLECLTGKPVYAGHSLNEVVCRQLEGEMVRMPRWLNEHPVADLLAKIVSKNPISRLTSTRRISQYLQEIDFSQLDTVLTTPLQEEVGAGPDTTITHLHQYEDERQEQTLAIACIRISESKDLTFTTSDVEAVISRELEGLRQEINRLGGHVEISTANTLMVTFSREQGLAIQVANAVKNLPKLLHAAAPSLAQLQKDAGVSLQVSASLHSGKVWVSPMGSLHGTTPHLSLELLGRAQAGQLLISESVYQILSTNMHKHFIHQPGENAIGQTEAYLWQA